MCVHVWKPPADSRSVTLRLLADTHITVHHSILGGTAVPTDKRHMELHLAVKVIWKYHEPNRVPL